MVVIWDEDKQRLTHYQTDDAFGFKQAYDAVKEAKKHSLHFERFTNADYVKLETLDFRSVRYKKDEIYNKPFETVLELEDPPKS